MTSDKIKESMIRIYDRHLMTLIQDWEALDSLLDELTDYDYEFNRVYEARAGLERIMMTLISQAEERHLITWDDWRRIHAALSWIGYSAEDRR